MRITVLYVTALLVVSACRFAPFEGESSGRRLEVTLSSAPDYRALLVPFAVATDFRTTGNIWMKLKPLDVVEAEEPPILQLPGTVAERAENQLQFSLPDTVPFGAYKLGMVITLTSDGQPMSGQPYGTPLQRTVTGAWGTHGDPTFSVTSEMTEAQVTLPLVPADVVPAGDTHRITAEEVKVVFCKRIGSGGEFLNPPDAGSWMRFADKTKTCSQVFGSATYNPVRITVSKGVTALQAQTGSIVHAWSVAPGSPDANLDGNAQFQLNYPLLFDDGPPLRFKFYSYAGGDDGFCPVPVPSNLEFADYDSGTFLFVWLKQGNCPI